MRKSGGKRKKKRSGGKRKKKSGKKRSGNLRETVKLRSF